MIIGGLLYSALLFALGFAWRGLNDACRALRFDSLSEESREVLDRTRLYRLLFSPLIGVLLVSGIDLFGWRVGLVLVTATVAGGRLGALGVNFSRWQRLA